MFTWISDDWKEPSDVPDRVVAYIRTLWSKGEEADTIAEIFEIPVEWVALFVRQH